MNKPIDLIKLAQNDSTGMSSQIVALDTLQNLVTGFGTDRDKNVTNTFVFNELTQQELEDAYRGDWIARKVIEIPVHDATREWRAWQAEGDQIEAIEETERRIGLKAKLIKARVLARLYGGGALVLGVDGSGNPHEPLDPTRVKQGGLKFVHAVSRHQLTSGPIDRNPMSPFFGEPEYYQHHVEGAAIIRIHPSRVVRFVGSPVPDDRLSVDGWGDSVLCAIEDAVKNVAMTTSSMAAMVSELKLDIIAVPNLLANLATTEYASKLINRFRLANIAKSSVNALLIDKEEEWQRISASFAGSNELLQQYLLIVSAAADIPATRMLGMSPGGLNSTGESDVRNYYDRLRGEQEDIVRPAMARIDEVLIWSSLGMRDENIHYGWNPLWQMTDDEKANIALKKAQVFQIDVSTGLLPQDALTEARKNQLIEDGTYPGIELAFEESDQEIMREEDFNKQMERMKQFAANSNSGPGPRGDRDRDGVFNEGRDARPDVGGSDFIKVGPGRYRLKKGGKKIYNWNQVKLYYATGGLDSKKIVGDALPRTLYVRRDVKNAEQIVAWAKSQGFEQTISGEKMHVTIAFSRMPLDWSKVGESWASSEEDGSMRIKPGGMRLVERLGQNGEAVVLMFASSELCYRHESIKSAGASWDWPEYQPHITISFDSPDIKVRDIEPYRGEIILGPEIFEEVNEDWRETISEDAAKRTQSSVNFREASSPRAKKRCGTCKHFIAGRMQCELVAGRIEQEDLCDLFEARE